MYRILVLYFAEYPFRNCPKRGSNNASSVDLPSIRRAKWAEKRLLGRPEGYAIDASEAFRTVSPRTRVNNAHFLNVTGCLNVVLARMIIPT